MTQQGRDKIPWATKDEEESSNTTNLISWKLIKAFAAWNVDAKRFSWSTQLIHFFRCKRFNFPKSLSYHKCELNYFFFNCYVSDNDWGRKWAQYQSTWVSNFNFRPFEFSSQNPTRLFCFKVSRMAMSFFSIPVFDEDSNPRIREANNNFQCLHTSRWAEEKGKLSI